MMVGAGTVLSRTAIQARLRRCSTGGTAFLRFSPGWRGRKRVSTTPKLREQLEAVKGSRGATRESSVRTCKSSGPLAERTGPAKGTGSVIRRFAASLRPGLQLAEQSSFIRTGIAVPTPSVGGSATGPRPVRSFRVNTKKKEDYLPIGTPTRASNGLPSSFRVHLSSTPDALVAIVDLTSANRLGPWVWITTRRSVLRLLQPLRMWLQLFFV